MRHINLRVVVLCALFLAPGAAAADKKTDFRPGKRFYYSKNDFLNYETAGRGPVTVIFLHGFGASLHVWDDVITHLPKVRYTLYLLDLKGAGFSSRPHEETYSIQDNAALVNKFIKEKNLSGYTLVGHSFGGAVALFAAIGALDDPALRPVKLVLIDPAAYPDEIPGYISAIRTPVLRNMINALTTGEFQVRHILKKVFYDKKRITDSLVRRYTAFLGEKDYTYALWQTADKLVPEHPERYTSRYKDLTYPVLLIWGKEDGVLPLAYGERLAKALPAARLKVLEKCGHDAPEEFPETTARLIASFDAWRDYKKR